MIRYLGPGLSEKRKLPVKDSSVIWVVSHSGHFSNPTELVTNKETVDSTTIFLFIYLTKFRLF